ncbi:GMP synthase [Thermus sp. CCB_US3_UF1]|nr:GMP synthase [Thermus sp. CCB_US3_UF1]
MKVGILGLLSLPVYPWGDLEVHPGPEPPGAWPFSPHSHSMVAGGLEVMS